jgi:hypothetical protein
MLKRHEVEILLKAGRPKTEVARLAGVSLCSVKRIAEETPVMQREDPSGGGHRVPIHPERLRGTLHDGRRTHRRSFERQQEGTPTGVSGNLHAPSRAELLERKP